MRRVLTGFVLLTLVISGFTLKTDVDTILSKLRDYIKYQPQEKVYLHLDKPLYAAGEDIWFSTYLLNASTHQLDSISKVVYVELFNSSNKIVFKRLLYSPLGTSRGDFHLPDTLPEGTYTIRAYTHFMKNRDPDFYFTKRIPILSLSKFHKPAQKVQPPDIQFFPEGGNLVAGVENRVAFKAINRNETGILVEGAIKDSSGKEVAKFESEYAGMGFFTLTPVYGEKYEASVKSISGNFPLPTVENEGFLLRVMDMGATLKIIVFKNLNSSATAPVSLVAHVRGQVNFTAQAEMKGKSLVLNVPKSQFATGISQITLFDSSGTPQCERLVFINRPGLKVSVQADKPLYKQREKVNLDVSVLTADGDPIAGAYSISVYDSEKIEDPEPYPISIVEYLLLTSDLTGRIDDPGYYLKDTLATTKKHLDLLMMTHGWRRFTWKEVQDEKSIEVYPPELGIPISGSVMKSAKKPAKNIKLKLLTSDGDFISLETDSLGSFYTDGLMHFDTIQVAVQTNTKGGAQTAYIVNFNPPGEASNLNRIPPTFPYFEAADFLTQVDERIRVMRGYAPGEDAIQLKGVEIKAQRIEENKPFKLYGIADATVESRDFAGGYSSIFQAMQGKVAGLTISGPPGNETVTIRSTRSFNYTGVGANDPLFLLNGFQVDIIMIRNIPVNDVQNVDILKNPDKTSLYGSRGANGVFAVTTKPGVVALQGPIASLKRVKYPGFYRAREFYIPKYDKPQENNITDIRNTLYWNPSVKINSNGKARLSFYASDVLSSYRIQIEGISADGNPGYGTGTMVVK